MQTIDHLIIFAADYLLYLLGLIFLLLILFSEKSRQAATLKIFIAALFIGFVIALVGGRLFYDPRPFVVEHVKPLVAHNSDNGFPSDHTLLAMTIALTVLINDKKLGSSLLVAALLIGLARVLAKVHHPVDILGSVLIAVLAFYLALSVVKKFPPKAIAPRNN